MNTLYELYDAHEPIMNIIGAWILKPQTVVFFHYNIEDEGAEKKKLLKIFRDMGMRVSVQLVRLDGLNVDSLLAWMEQNVSAQEEYAIELSGGDDVMLFMAGRRYEQLHCPIYARRPGGRYYSLADGKALKTEAPKLSVAQHLMLYGCTVERYGRVQSGDLSLSFRLMAMEMLKLQKQHPFVWMKQTMCIQQAVARRTEDSLVLSLSNAQLRSFELSAQKGHLFKQMLAAGALTDLKCNHDMAELTFKNQLTMECLCDHGIWLEVYIYHLLKVSGEFDDVGISCIVNWENEKTVNELDVMATAGLGMLIISCKTCVPDLEALGELNVLRERLGGVHAQAMLAAMPKGTDRMDGVYARCEDMDIKLLDIRQYSAEELVAFFRRTARKMKSTV